MLEQKIHNTTETQAKRGVPRSVQELFMVLVRFRCGLMSLDTANRFGISQAQYSRIERTWLSFPYTRKSLTTCNKSANKPSTSCVRTACYKLSTSLEKLLTTCNNLVDIVRLVTRLFQQSCYKS